MESIPTSSNSVVRWFKLDQFEPERAVTSHWVSSKTFLLIRTLPTLYSVIIMFADIGTTAQSGSFNFFFAYFTNLTYVGLFSYLVVCLAIVLFSNYNCPLMWKKLTYFFACIVCVYPSCPLPLDAQAAYPQVILSTMANSELSFCNSVS